MGAPKITSFIIGMILVGVIVSTIMLLVGNLASNYGINDANNLSVLVKTQELNDQANQIQEDVMGTDGSEGSVDMLGAIFTSGYATIKTTKTSLETFQAMASDVQKDEHLSGISNISSIIGGLVAIVVILVVIGIFLAAVLKRDL